MLKKPLYLFLAFVLFLQVLTVRGFLGNFYLDPNKNGEQAIAGKPPFETSMERGRYAQVVSLVESGNINVDEFKDFLRPDLAWYNNHFYSTFPPGMSLLSVPFYLVGKVLNVSQVITYTSSTFFLLLTILFMIKTSRLLGMSSKISYIVASAFALSTSAWTYSSTFSAHTLSAFVAITMFYLFLKIPTIPAQQNKHKIFYYFLIGLLYSLNLLVDYPNMIILFPIVLLAIVREASISNEQDGAKTLNLPKKSLLTIMGSVFGLILFIAINSSLYGKALYFSNTYTIKWMLKDQDISSLQLSNDIFKDKNYVTERFSLEKLAVGAKVLTIDSDRGVFQFYPFFIFGLIGLFYSLKNRRLIFLIPFVVFILNIVIYGSYDDPWGGWAFGPRYLIVSSPLFLLLAGYAHEKLPNKFWVRIPAFLSLAFGTGIAAIGALTTTAVPPSIEVAKKGIYSNYLYNFQYLWKNGSSSFIYNSLFSLIIPQVYYVFVCVLAISLIAGLFFINRSHLEHLAKIAKLPFLKF